MIILPLKYSFRDESRFLGWHPKNRDSFSHAVEILPDIACFDDFKREEAKNIFQLLVKSVKTASILIIPPS